MFFWLIFGIIHNPQYRWSENIWGGINRTIFNSSLFLQRTFKCGWSFRTFLSWGLWIFEFSFPKPVYRKEWIRKLATNVTKIDVTWFLLMGYIKRIVYNAPRISPDKLKQSIIEGFQSESSSMLANVPKGNLMFVILSTWYKIGLRLYPPFF